MKRVAKYRRKHSEVGGSGNSGDAAGASTYELADEFGSYRSTISRILKKCGIKVTHNCADRNALVKKSLELYADFMKPEDIGKVVDLHVSTVLKILHENDVRIRSSGEYRQKK